MARVTVPTGAISTAERLHIKVMYTANEWIEFTPPEFDALFDGWTLTAGEIHKTRRNKLRFEYTQEIRLEPFLPGEYEIPSMIFRWADAEQGESGELVTDSYSITVTSVLDESDEIPELADIKDVATPERETDWLTIVLISSGAALLVALIAAFAFRRLTRERVRPVDRTPAHAAALALLGSLDPASVTNEQDAKRFYAEASGIVRSYIEDRFRLHAPDRTTEEFLRECGGSYEFAPDDIALLEQFLNIADLVKFAKHTTDAADARSAVGALRGFIERTSDDSRVIVTDRETGARLRVETIGEDSGGEP